MTAVGKSPSADKETLYSAQREKSNVRKRVYFESTESKAHATGVATLVGPTDHPYPTRSCIPHVHLPDDPPSLSSHKRKKEPKIDFDTFMLLAINSVQRHPPAVGKSTTMKWNRKVEEAAEDLMQDSQANDQLKKLFKSRDRAGLKTLLINKAKNR